MKQQLNTAQQDANAKLKLMETFGNTSFDHPYFAEICDTPLTGAFKKKAVVHAGLGGSPVPQEKTAEVWHTLSKTQRRGKTSAYIHIPFCSTHCLYCGFFANPAQKDNMQAYAKALIRELDGVDLYQLIRFPGGRLDKAVSSGRFKTLADQTQRALMFETGVNRMTLARYRRLSISYWGRKFRERNRYNLAMKEKADCLAQGMIDYYEQISTAS